MPKCPHCKEPGQQFYFMGTVRRPNGQLGSTSGYSGCFTCQGTNEITDEHLQAIEKGKAIREYRIHEQGASLRERAAELGLNGVDYSDIEHGRLRDDMNPIRDRLYAGLPEASE